MTMTIRSRNIPLTGFLLIIFLALSACGGGGGGSGGSSPTSGGSTDGTNDSVLAPLTWDEGSWDNVTWE